ncbi:MAG TPA: hypothetical protein VHP13_01970 [Gammaproteobacteria bacterium]|jgi:hypothetical protein|nr:hypothetical protein [Gammaproteobacteria bacterium]
MGRHFRSCLTAWFSLPLLLALTARAGADEVQGFGNHTVIYLGSIAVDGQRNIYHALQDIKVALDQPLSSDPKLAEVMVCRLADEIGIRAKQVLICGTNRALLQNRELMQVIAAMDGGLEMPGAQACGDAACGGRVVGILEDSINMQPHLYLMQQVNGQSLNALLASIPYPSYGRQLRVSTPVSTLAPIISPV